MRSIEMTGEKFDLETYLSAQELCRRITERIASQVGPGLSEAEGQQLIKEEFRKEGVTKFWHPSKFRIGSETTKSFREPPEASLRLRPGDLFFLDLGPVIGDHEADYGKTFVLSSDDPMRATELTALSEASVRVWKETAREWRRSGLSGVGLFEFADRTARDLGFQLNPLMAGHRLGDFPHALFSKDKLFSVEIVPRENLWVLEIHVISARLERGAFFEDILS